MITIKGLKFYQGPNICHNSSGIHLILNDPGSIMQFELDKSQSIHINRILSDIFLNIGLVNPSFTFDQFIKSSTTLIDLFFIISKTTMHDFCIKPTLGHLIKFNKSSIDLFIPCDDIFIGKASSNFTLNIINNLQNMLDDKNKIYQHKFYKQLFQTYQFYRQRGLNQSTMLLVRTAETKGIPSYRLQIPGQLTQLGQGYHRKRISETLTDNTNSFGYLTQRDKLMTTQLLRQNNLPNTNTQNIISLDQALQLSSKIGFPLVVKPRSAGKGKGITVNINNIEQLKHAIQVASKYNSGVIMERYIPGKDHRILVIDGKMVSAVKRLPASVTGDGKHTVKELIYKTNLDPARGHGFDKLLVKIELDNEALDQLSRIGYTLDTIPPKDKEIPLRGTANISRGGTSVDVTGDIHPDNKMVVERAARILGIDVAGVDFQTPDISKSWKDIPSAILEINASPGLRPNLIANKKNDIVSPIIDNLFPHGTDGRIPTVGITGSLGKTTTSQMIASILKVSGKTVALSTTQGAWIGEDQIMKGDVAGGSTAHMLMQDPIVEAGVFEFARGGLVKKGMTLDCIDIGILLNVHDNHLGLDGIKTRVDMALVKSLVVKNARKLAIINADDPLCLEIAKEFTTERLALVSTISDNVHVQAHLKAGGLGAYIEEEKDIKLKLFQNNQLVDSINASQIPAAHNGTFKPIIINALFAMVATYKLGVKFSIIKNTLYDFHSDYKTNIGRMNLVEGLPYKLIVTWADGPVAISELKKHIDTYNTIGKKRLLLVCMGNRQDQFVINTAKASAKGFDQYICTDWENLRGRNKGEVSTLLAQGLHETGISNEHIVIESDYSKALDYAFSISKENDLLVILNFNSKKVWEKIQKFIEK